MLHRRVLFYTAWRYAHRTANSSGREVRPEFPEAVRRVWAAFRNPSSVESRVTTETGRIIAEIRARKTAGTFRPIHHRPWHSANAGM
jgi:hypothetical protein